MGLLGRDAELTLVAERLADRRLVTLIGPGGIGKTALARAAAERSRSRFGEGTQLVDLTRVDTAHGVRESLATQLGYTSFRGLIEAPGDHPVLIVLDNCEHVLDAAAEALDELLQACDMPTVLATSRTALELAGEVVIPVGPLELPPAGVIDGPAVRLFLQRAQEAGVELAPSEVVATLCRRLDGVPLAIELAAARTRAMTPAEVLARLGAGLDVLDRPRRRSARRHQSLRAAIDWSYDLLDPVQQGLLARVTVFSGPFTAELAHAVASAPGTSVAETQDHLDDLVAASMVVAEPVGPTTWYRLLETMRAFGRDRLEAQGEREAIERRFVEHVVGAAVDIIQRGSSTWSAEVLADLLALYGNISAAVRWCLDHDEEAHAVLLVAVLWGVVHQAHTEEIGALAESVLARWPDSEHPLRADAVATAATCRYMLGDHAGAISLAEATLEAAGGSPFAPATLRRSLGQSHRACRDAEAALVWFEAAADEAHRLGLVAMATEAMSAQAQVLSDLGRHDEAMARVAAAIDEATAAGSEVGAAWARTIEGSVLLRVDPPAAMRALDAALAEATRLRYEAATSVALRALALGDLCLDHPLDAAERVVELLEGLLARGSTYELRLVFDVAAALLARSGRTAAAADLAATALSLPVVSITASVGHELFPLDPTGGSVLPVRDAIRLTRAEMDLLLSGRAAATPDPDPARNGVFRRTGELWEVGYGDGTVTVRATKGMADLARLLGSPGREVHCLELAGAAVEEGGTGEVLDAAARRAYEARVRDLQHELDEADAHNDRGRAERAAIELDAVVDQLTEALGLGGRSRNPGASAERARSAVTQRIRATIRRIDSVHPGLGRHLRASIRTGTFCSYAPEAPVRWQL